VRHEKKHAGKPDRADSCRTSVRVRHAFDRELALLDVQNRHTGLLANTALQLAIARGHNVAFLLRTQREKSATLVSIEEGVDCNQESQRPSVHGRILTYLGNPIDQAIIGICTLVRADETLETRILGDPGLGTPGARKDEREMTGKNYCTIAR
jgi:hypothetical protein